MSSELQFLEEGENGKKGKRGMDFREEGGNSIESGSRGN